MLVLKSVFVQQEASLHRSLMAQQSLESECAEIKNHIAFFAVSRAGIFLESSPMFEQLVGYSKHELTSESIDKLHTDPVTQKPFYQALWQGNHDSSNAWQKLTLRHKDRQSVHVKASYVPIKEADETVTKVNVFLFDDTAEYEKRTAYSDPGRYAQCIYGRDRIYRKRHYSGCQ